MLAQEAPLHFRADDSRVDYHWCAPDDDVCKRWEQNDGLATKPQDSDAGWTVWCFCGERMQLFSSEEPCRLELSCTCRICGKFAQTGLRFIATGDDIWHCATCGATEQTKKGSREPLGRPGSPELRMLREQGHVLLECVRMSLGKDAAYKALGQHFHFGQSGVADTVRAIHALRQIVPKQSDASLRVSAQKRRLLRLQDDDSSCRALASELKEDMSQDVKDTLLFGFANAGHASLLRLLLEARCSANVQRTKDGCSPLHCALVHGRHDAANVLVQTKKEKDVQLYHGAQILVPMQLKQNQAPTDRAWLKVDFDDPDLGAARQSDDAGLLVAMATRVASAAAFALLLGASLAGVAEAKAKTEDGKFCMAKSCDADGHCEERSCAMLDAAADSKPAAKGMIMSCQG
eukprot:s3189_g2.t1